MFRRTFSSVLACSLAAIALSGCLTTAWEAAPPAAGPDGEGVVETASIAIRVMGQPELTGVYTVDPDGNISMPLINTVPVAGLTPKEMENAIAARLRNGYLRNPSVSVQPLELRPFYILGEVRQAGRYTYQPGMTVAQAVAMARGFTERAHTGEVLLTRRTAQGTKTYRVPMTTQLYPGDIIYVKERWF